MGTSVWEAYGPSPCPACPQALLHDLLTEDPKKRITAPRALQHAFISGEQEATTPTSKAAATTKRLPKTSSQPPVS
jgi:serine/threonine protein kinase